jgi:hypothetical protein
MKRIIFGIILSAVCGMSHADNLVINNSSQISFFDYDEQPDSVTGAENTRFGGRFVATSAGVFLGASSGSNSRYEDGFYLGSRNGGQQQKASGFAMLKEQTSRYGKFNYLLSSDGSYAGDAEYGHYVVDVKSANMAPVPEPQTYAMMLAGVGLLGVSIRRRKDNNFD